MEDGELTRGVVGHFPSIFVHFFKARKLIRRDFSVNDLKYHLFNV